MDPARFTAETDEAAYACPAAALRIAVRIIGSQSATSRLLGVTQGAVSKWLDQGKHLPPGHVLKVEAATKIPRWVLRPDLYPRESAVAQAPEPAADPSFGDMAPAR